MTEFLPYAGSAYTAGLTPDTIATLGSGAIAVMLDGKSYAAADIAANLKSTSRAFIAVNNGNGVQITGSFNTKKFKAYTQKGVAATPRVMTITIAEPATTDVGKVISVAFNTDYLDVDDKVNFWKCVVPVETGDTATTLATKVANTFNYMFGNQFPHRILGTYNKIIVATSAAGVVTVTGQGDWYFNLVKDLYSGTESLYDVAVAETVAYVRGVNTQPYMALNEKYFAGEKGYNALMVPLTYDDFVLPSFAKTAVFDTLTIEYETEDDAVLGNKGNPLHPKIVIVAPTGDNASLLATINVIREILNVANVDLTAVANMQLS